MGFHSQHLGGTYDITPNIKEFTEEYLKYIIELPDKQRHTNESQLQIKSKKFKQYFLENGTVIQWKNPNNPKSLGNLKVKMTIRESVLMGTHFGYIFKFEITSASGNSLFPIPKSVQLKKRMVSRKRLCDFVDDETLTQSSKNIVLSNQIVTKDFIPSKSPCFILDMNKMSYKMMSQNPSMDYKEIIKQNALNKIKVEQANESDTKEEEEEESESDSEMYSSESMSVDSNNNEFQVPTNDLVSFKAEKRIKR